MRISGFDDFRVLLELFGQFGLLLRFPEVQPPIGNACDINFQQWPGLFRDWT